MLVVGAIAFLVWQALGGQQQRDSTEYFPKEFGLEPITTRWYSSDLQAFGEKPLKQSGPNAKVLRFLWLRSFHPMVCITVNCRSKASSVCSIEAKQLDRSITYGQPAPTVVKDVRYSLSVEQEKALLEGFKEAKFWQLDSFDDYTRPESMKSLTDRLKGPQLVCDGAIWMIEGLDNGKYQLVTGWCPEFGPIRNLGTMLLKQANFLPEDPRAVY